MKASKLLSEIQSIIWKEGDMEVMASMDHGQEPMQVDHATLVYTVEPEVYMPEYHELDDLDDETRAYYEKNGTKMILLT